MGVPDEGSGLSDWAVRERAGLDGAASGDPNHMFKRVLCLRCSMDASRHPRK